MSITDLLDRVSFSPASGGDGAPAASEAPSGGLAPTVEIELPPVEQAGGLDPVTLPPSFEPVVEVIGSEPGVEIGTGAPDGPSASAPDTASGSRLSVESLPAEASAIAPALEPDATATAPPPAEPRPPSPPPLPSWGIAVIGGLSLLCLSLAAALALALSEPDTAEAIAPTADTTSPPRDEAAPEPAPTEEPVEPAATPASFSAEPTAIPVELLTRLEQASDESLDVELARLLEAMQFGFGRRSAQLEPTLRSYVYRMGSRFEWNPDTFRVAVTAPDPALATARAALLERLFEDAVAAGRLDVGSGVGPHALTLVTE